MDVRIKDIDLIGTVKVVMVKGEKGDVGVPTDSQVLTAVSEWLSAHPEATTTVQDGAITEAKLANDVKHMFGTKADAIIKTASGSIASFDDGGDDLPLKSLLVNIEPKQSGSGDPSPSNVRPISGYEGVNVTRVGKNLWNPHLYTGMGYNPTVGSTIEFVDSDRQLTETSEDVFTITYTSTWLTNVMVIPITKDSHLAIDGTISSTGTLGVSYVYLDENFKVLRVNNNTSDTQNISDVLYPENNLTTDKGYFAILITNRGTANATITIAKPQIEKGDTHTAYEPYNGTTYTTSLGQTVYGGTLDVVSGVVTIDRAMVDLGTLGWTTGTDSIGLYFKTTLSDIKVITSGTANILCSIYATTSSSSVADKQIAQGTGIGKAIYVRDSAYTSASAFKTAMNGVQLVYELATPTEITLTPTQVTTLLGNNNIWADSGSVEVEYRADTTLAYNKLLSAIASLS